MNEWMKESFIYSGKVNWEQALFSNDALSTKYVKTHIQYDHITITIRLQNIEQQGLETI